MFNLFNNKEKKTDGTGLLAAVESDWHCHVLPRIDDGSGGEEETQAMLEKYVRLGIKKVVATPHIHSDYYKNTPQTIQKAHQVGLKIIEKNQLPITLEYSAEYFANDYFLELIAENNLLPIENQYILFELSMQQQPLFGKKLVESIQKLGYTPLLAHPERYRYWHNKPQEWTKWREMGVCFQLNLLSLVGQYGSSEKKAAESMLDLDYIDAVGSDAHGPNHLEKLSKLADNLYFKNLQQLPLLNKI